MRVLILRVDGTEEVHEIDRARAVKEINRLIGADTFDAVNLRDGRVMLVDDNGYDCEFVDHGNANFEMRPLRARRPVNEKATALYHGICRAGTTHQIVGDVAIAVDADFA
jgi:hypothetical protein